MLLTTATVSALFLTTAFAEFCAIIIIMFWQKIYKVFCKLSQNSKKSFKLNGFGKIWFNTKTFESSSTGSVYDLKFTKILLKFIIDLPICVNNIVRNFKRIFMLLLVVDYIYQLCILADYK